MYIKCSRPRCIKYAIEIFQFRCISENIPMSKEFLIGQISQRTKQQTNSTSFNKLGFTIIGDVKVSYTRLSFKLDILYTYQILMNQYYCNFHMMMKITINVRYYDIHFKRYFQRSIMTCLSNDEHI